MKVAVVGIGKMGMLHAGILNALDGVELCAISDTSRFLLKIAKGLKGDLAVYDDYVKMLNKENPDAVVIATPVFLHLPMAMECVNRNMPFLMEKPLSSEIEGVAELAAAIKDRNLPSMIGYMMRYVETFRKAKEIIDAGILGRLVTFNATIYVSQLFQAGKGWRYSKKESGGGVVISQASHLIDLLQWFFGPVDVVSAQTKNWYSKEVEDFAHVFFEFNNGLTGWFDSSWSIRHHRLLQVNITLHAENGNLLVSDDYVRLFLDNDKDGYASGWTNIYNAELFTGVEIDIGGPQYTKQDMDFVNAVRNNSKVQSDFDNAFYVQKLVDAIYTSASQHGAPQKIK
jgi:predicted dehydrogenase